MQRLPTRSTAVGIITAFVGRRVQSVRRFPTGLRHFVYDCAFSDGTRLVLRVSRIDDLQVVKNSIALSEQLRPLGVPLPALLHVDLSLARFPFPFVVLERLPGEDLGGIYRYLSGAEKQQIAERIVQIGGLVQLLPRGKGFGFGSQPNSQELQSTWKGFVGSFLARAMSRTVANGIIPQACHQQVMRAVDNYQDEFQGVQPTPFLHDTTTKNVLIHERRLAGIVDVDDLCFGDPLWTPALTKASLIAANQSTDYVDLCWRGAEQTNSATWQRVEIYCAVLCLDLASEMGQWFGDRLLAIDRTKLDRLLKAAADLSGRHPAR